jgi:hypothetical protein
MSIAIRCGKLFLGNGSCNQEMRGKRESLFSSGFNLLPVDLPLNSVGEIQEKEMRLPPPKIIGYLDPTDETIDDPGIDQKR